MPLEPPSEGLFPTKEALVKHCKDHAISQGYVITKNGGGNARQVVLKCDRGGVRNSQSTGLRTSASRRIGCPFLLYGATTKRDDGQWKLVVKNGTHNHEAEEEIAAHPAARRFDENQMEVFKQLHSARASPRHIMSELRQRNPDIPINSRDVYNAIGKSRRDSLQGRSPIHTLLLLAQQRNYAVKYDCWETGEIRYLCLVHPEAVPLAKLYPLVLLMDCTYKTNKFRLPLLHVIGITNLFTTFTCCYVFISEERLDDYLWALQSIRDIFAISPSVIASDRELALMNAISIVFPQAANILCFWHIEKNIVANLKSEFSQEEFKSFLRDWSAVCRSNLTSDFDEQWSAFRNKYSQQPRVVDYLQTTWIGPHKTRFVAAWINRFMHLGATVTSRVEGAHGRLKRYLGTSTGDLLTVFNSMHEAWENEFVEWRIQRGTERTKRVGGTLSHPLFDQVHLQISRYALHEINEQLKKVHLSRRSHDAVPLTECTGTLTRTMGIPCAHHIVNFLDYRSLQINEIHQQWWLVRQQPLRESHTEHLTDQIHVESNSANDASLNSSLISENNVTGEPILQNLTQPERIEQIINNLQNNALTPVATNQLLDRIEAELDMPRTLVQDPRMIVPRGRPPGSRNAANDSSTRRLPSQFELAERPARQCRNCRLTGHNVRTCPNRNGALQENQTTT